MTVTVERRFEVPAARETIWDWISDPANRAKAISVVDSFEVDPEDPTRATWHLRLPIPLVRSTIAVKTRDTERDPPRFVAFEGESRAFTVRGEHEITETDGMCELRNRFVVDGKLPGVEAHFRAHFGDELENLADALAAELGGQVER